MSNLLVFLQSAEGRLPKTSLACLAAAKAIKERWKKESLVGICLGPGAKQAADEALHYGVANVLFSEDAGLAKYLAIPYAQALLSAVTQSSADTIVFPATSLGKDLAPRLSAALEAGQASDIVAVNDDGSLKRPMYAGDAFADVEITSAKRVVTVRGTAFQPCAREAKQGEAKELVLSLNLNGAGEVLGLEGSKSDRPELADAEIVVSGGRALQSSENFQKYIFPLAEALGAAVGASRAAVDSGYAPNDWQVGQTGKVVAPNLYVAVGISGAIQHLAGMKDSKTIVAINKDAEAPIFEVADFGLVADLYQAVPELTEAIKKAKSL